MARRNVGELLVKIGADSLEFQKNMDKAQFLATKFSKNLTSLGKNMSIALTVPLTALGAKSLMEFAKLEQAMKEVSTLSQKITDDIKGFRDKIETLTSTIPVGAEEAAKALYQIVSAGHDGANGMKVLEVAAKAAIGGVTDTVLAADAITTLLNAYGLTAESASKISDQLFTTVRLGKTTFGELGATISTVAASAASFGIPTEEILAAVATLTKMGVPTAQAMTQIRSAIVATASVLGDGAFKGRTFQEALKLIADNTGGSFTELKKDAKRIEAINAILVLAGKNANVAAEDLEQLKNSSGAATAAFNKMGDSFINKSKLFANNLSTIAVQIGEFLKPIAEGFMDLINSIAQALSGFSKPVRNAIIGTAMLAAAIGPLSLALGSLLKILPLLKAGMLSIASPIGIAITAAAALGVAIYALSQKESAVASASRRAADAYDDEAAKITSLRSIVNNANISYDKRNEALDELKSKVPDYHASLSKEGELIDNNSDAIDNYLQKLEKEIRFNIYKDAFTESIKEMTSLDDKLKKLESNFEKIKESNKKQPLSPIQSPMFGGGITASQQLEQHYSNEVKKVKDAIKLAQNNRDELQKLLEASIVTGGGSGKKKLGEDDGGDEEKKRLGLIGELEGKIADITKKRNESYDTSKISSYNSELEMLKKQLENLQNIKSRGFVQSVNISTNAKLPEMQLPGIDTQKWFSKNLAPIGDAFTKLQQITEKGDVFGITKMQQAIDGEDLLRRSIEDLIDKGYKRGDLALEDLIKRLKEYEEITIGLKPKTDGLNEVFNSLAGTMSGLSRAFQDGAAAWMNYISNFLQTIPALINGLEFLIAKEKEKTVIGAASAVSNIPILGPVLAIGAIASSVAALASIPKFADGGLLYGPTLALMGEYPGAGSNPEVIAPLSKLQSMIGDSVGESGVGGNVRFEIEGYKLVGILNKENRKRKRLRG